MPPPPPALAEKNALPIAPPTLAGSHSAVTWWNRWPGRTLRILGLTLVVIALWLTIENRWGRDFLIPARYDYDAHYILGMMKLAQEGDLGLFTHICTDSLGAPFRGQLNDWPEPQRAIIWFGGKIAQVIGLMPAANFMLILSCILSSVSFYSALRLWRVSRLYSWALAIPYAFLPHMDRSLMFLGMIFTGMLPLQFYVLWYTATTQRLYWRSLRFKLTIVIALLTGLLNIYWIFIFLQLYSLSLLYRFVKYRKDCIRALIPLGVTCLVTACLLSSFFIYSKVYGENVSALVRSYRNLEEWSLKPIDLFLPGKGDGFSILSNLLSRYYDGGAMIIGEKGGGYIGVCSILGLLVLVFRGGQRQLIRRSPSLPWLAAVWLIAYCSVGGIHSVFSLIFDFYKIRATNRYSPAIGTIGILYFSFFLYHMTRGMRGGGRVPILWGVVLFALLDHAYKSYKVSNYIFPISKTKEIISYDRDLVSNLETILPVGSSIYILPAIDFPEPFLGRGSHKGRFSYYESMRPFLYSTQLRYSYGSNKGRQGADWQLDVQELPAGEMAAKLESYGFSGILLNRKGYEDRGEQLLAEFFEAGWPMEFEQGVDNEWAFIRLKPAENPILPTKTPYALTIER